jgi:hypothetical protein
MKPRSISGATLATAAALLVLSAAAPVAPTLAAGMMKCFGANGCKGKGSCKSVQNDCKGRNACKGQGWLMLLTCPNAPSTYHFKSPTHECKEFKANAPGTPKRDFEGSCKAGHNGQFDCKVNTNAVPNTYVCCCDYVQ